MNTCFEEEVIAEQLKREMGLHDVIEGSAIVVLWMLNGMLNVM